MKVLLVDDEPDIRRIGELSLRAAGGWDVILAASGPAGLDAAKEHQPEVVLLDMMMPGMDGFMVLAKLREIPGCEATPVIFMTARVNEDEIASYFEAGAAGVVHKPFDPVTLSADIRRSLDA